MNVHIRASLTAQGLLSSELPPMPRVSTGDAEPVVSRRSVIVGAALVAGAKVFAQGPSAAQHSPALPVVLDPTMVQGRVADELGDRSAFVRPRRKISNSGIS